MLATPMNSDLLRVNDSAGTRRIRGGSTCPRGQTLALCSVVSFPVLHLIRFSLYSTCVWRIALILIQLVLICVPVTCSLLEGQENFMRAGRRGIDDATLPSICFYFLYHRYATSICPSLSQEDVFYQSKSANPRRMTGSLFLYIPHIFP